MSQHSDTFTQASWNAGLRFSGEPRPSAIGEADLIRVTGPNGRTLLRIGADGTVEFELGALGPRAIRGVPPKPFTVTGPRGERTVYPMEDGTFCVADGGGWIEGSYDTVEAALSVPAGIARREG